MISVAPLLSLIIPTRERAQTLAATLATAVATTHPSLEIIVSDNVSADDTKAVVDRVNDSRVRYVNPGSRQSMCGNYEFALSKAIGSYVTIIGDDDAVIPQALDRLLVRLAALPEPLIHMWPLHIYDWPASDRSASVAYLAPQIPPSELNLKSKAKDVVRYGGWKYYELPSPYHAAIPRELLLKIRNRTGKVFHSTQPDVFTAMAIPAFADRAINLGDAVTLNGRSARSNGLGFVEKKARANIDRFISEYGDYRFHPSLPTSAPAAANMIPDAVLLATEMFPELYSNTAFDYGAMWAYICRLGFISHWEVINHRTEWKYVHEFSLARFLSLSVVHQAAVMRRKFLNATTPLGSLAYGVPDSIDQFVSMLQQDRSTIT